MLFYVYYYLLILYLVIGELAAAAATVDKMSSALGYFENNRALFLYILVKERTNENSVIRSLYV